jgi:HD superfamily phosphohydrolase
MNHRSSRWAVKTIIDPLYAPIRFRIYEKCDHLNLLSAEAHLPYGFSPYLLLDLQRMDIALRLLSREPSERNTHLNWRVKAIGNLRGRIRGLIRQYLEQRLGNATAQVLLPLHDEILVQHRRFVAAAYRVLNNEIWMDGQLDADRLGRVSQLFLPGHVFEITCPHPSESGPGEISQMTEEGRIYATLQSLMRSFEARRCEWLRQAGGLSSVHRGATHSRLAHMVGCVIVASNALSDVTVFPSDDIAIELGQYLLLRGHLQEFLAAIFLHDLGHPPLSHTLEANPFLKPRLDHEAITRALITSERETDDDTNWHYLTYSLLRLQDVLRSTVGTTATTARSDEGVSTTHIVLSNCGMNSRLIGEILRGPPKKDGATGEAGGREVSSSVSFGHHETDIAFLHALVESDLDFDRIDHIRRDSAVCGLSLTSFRVREMLQGMSVVLPRSSLYESNKTKDKQPFYFLLCPHSLMYALDLLGSRRLIYETVIFSDENCFINGVINQMIACAAPMLPHLKNLLPFITDQILSHFLTNKFFVGTQVEKLNRLLQGKEDHLAYELVARWQVTDPDLPISQDALCSQYGVAHQFNKEHARSAGRLPACVFYSTIRFIEDGKDQEKRQGEREWEPWLLLHKTLSDGKLHSLRELEADSRASADGFPRKPMPEHTAGLLYIWIARSLRAVLPNSEYQNVVLQLKKDLLLKLSGATPEDLDVSLEEEHVLKLAKRCVNDLDRAPQLGGGGGEQ